MTTAIQTDYEVGQDNVRIFGMELHNPVFFITAFLLVIFVVGTIMFPSMANTGLSAAKDWSIDRFDWLFVVAGVTFVIFCIALIFLPVSRVRIGAADARPDFSLFSWLAMLFAAGMGIGLMFWSVAEPVGYYTNWYGTPLNVTPETPAAASGAMGATMYHWGLHPWAIYGVVALSLAYFTYNHGMPLTVRSAFYPLLGEKVWGWAGHMIDILAVLATLFGLATSLGLGAKQAASGLHYIFGVSSGLNTQIGIIVGVTSVAVLSVVRGVHGGIRLLSNLNMLLALLLLLFVIVVGSGFNIVPRVAGTLASYASNMLPLSSPVGRNDETFYHA